MIKNPIIPKEITDQLLYNTVRICGFKDNGQTSTGTGFFFGITLDDKREVLLVLTNKHVIDECTKLKFRLHEAKNISSKSQPSGEFINVELENIKQFWIPHPKDEVDLGAITFGPKILDIKNRLNKNIYCITFNKNLIKKDKELIETTSIAEEVLMAGYPIGLWDEYNNYPIIRKGIAASHPASNFNNKNEGVVDIACFPGSSGSPIVTYNKTPIKRSEHSIFIDTEIRIMLLGLLYGGPTYTNEGEIKVKKIPTYQNIISINKQMMHLGYYIKAKEINALCEHILTEHVDKFNNKKLQLN